MDTMTVYIIVGFTAVLFIIMFNLLIGRKNQVEFSFASIDAQFKKRYDLIPNLVASCEKYMGYEQQILKDLAVTRAKMLESGTDERVSMDTLLTSQLRSVFALAENYPDLKAVETFTMLQRSLNEVEEQLAASRRAYNAAVTSYNNAVQMFPTNLVASMLGYRLRAWFEATAEEREPVKVWR